ncbi:MAG: RtcB family protein [Akkermansia sp.]
MNIIDTEKNKILMWNEGVEVDAFAMEQLRNLANHPFLHRHVAVMPDAHAGMGATIGSVFCADSAVIPSAVGVDIGCGMMLQQTGKLIDEALLADLPRIKQDILKWIPVGFRHQKVLRKAYRVGTLTELQSRFEAQRADPEFDPQSMEGIEYLNYIDPDSIKSRVPRLVLAAQDEMVSMLSDDLLAVLRRYPDLMNGPHPIHQVGSLGGGNHFIELCRNRADELVILIHSGSRNFGNVVGTLFTRLANAHSSDAIKEQKLAYLEAGSQYYDDYLVLMDFCVRMASLNRRTMVKIVQEVLRYHCGDGAALPFADCIHNYVDIPKVAGLPCVTRKGAIKVWDVDAAAPMVGIIPGAMGRKSYVVQGKGDNPLTYNSASHGAGRTMSRNKARQCIAVEDHIKSMEGIVCNAQASNVDENMKSYKDIELVMAAQAKNVDIIDELRPLLNVKG